MKSSVVGYMGDGYIGTWVRGTWVQGYKGSWDRRYMCMWLVSAQGTTRVQDVQRCNRDKVQGTQAQGSGTDQVDADELCGSLCACLDQIEVFLQRPRRIHRTAQQLCEVHACIIEQDSPLFRFCPDRFCSGQILCLLWRFAAFFKSSAYF